MDVPITKPSMASYADELNFAQLLENLAKDNHNGFMRITSGADEGYILFENGKQVAAEYGKFSKSEAVENIMSAVEDDRTLIEIFDLKPSHMDYIIDLNKPFLIEPSYDVSKVMKELESTDQAEPLIPEKISKSTNNTDSNTRSEPEPVSEVNVPESSTTSEAEPSPESETVTQTADSKSVNQTESATQAEPVSESENEMETAVTEAETAPGDTVSDAEPVSEPVKTSPVREDATSAQNKEKSRTTIEGEISPAPNTEKIPEVERTPVPSAPSETEPDTKVETEPLDRSKLLEKYGIKEMGEDDVEDLLDTYKGGSLNDDDMEKIELTLMNKIKKSIFGIPKIKGTEVMVFLENTTELIGDINIIIEYEGKGILSRFMGESKDIENLRRQVINIVQIEIKKSFRKYPEIVDNFNINVEIS